MKGTHIPKTKKQLSSLERELLEDLLGFTSRYDSPLRTAKTIAHQMEWDIRQTTSTLSNLVGMDLCIETDENTRMVNPNTNEFSSSEPQYGIPMNSVYYRRAIYASERKGDGLTLWHLLNADKLESNDYGKNLWPFRPIDRVKMTGKVVDVAGTPTLHFKIDSDLKELIGKDVVIRVDVKT